MSHACIGNIRQHKINTTEHYLTQTWNSTCTQTAADTVFQRWGSLQFKWFKHSRRVSWPKLLLLPTMQTGSADTQIDLQPVKQNLALKSIGLMSSGQSRIQQVAELILRDAQSIVTGWYSDDVLFSHHHLLSCYCVYVLRNYALLLSPSLVQLYISKLYLPELELTSGKHTPGAVPLWKN